MTRQTEFATIAPATNKRIFKMKQVLEWKIHLGAHKTGTTHAQDLLALNRGALADQGLDFLPRDPFRDHRVNRRIINGYRRCAFFRSKRPSLQDLVKPLRLGPERVLISEESIIGSPPDLLLPSFYPRLEERLNAWAKAAADEKVTTYLSIRDPGQILVSAYCHAVRYSKITSDFDAYCDQQANDMPSWLPLIQRIKSVLPDWPLRVWRFEDYIGRPFDLLRTITGCAIEDGNIDIPPSTRSPSVNTLARLRRLNRYGLPSVLRKPLATRMVADDTFESKFAPLSRERKLAYAEQYTRDVAKIRETYPGMLIE